MFFTKARDWKHINLSFVVRRVGLQNLIYTCYNYILPPITRSRLYMWFQLKEHRSPECTDFKAEAPAQSCPRLSVPERQPDLSFLVQAWPQPLLMQNYWKAPYYPLDPLNTSAWIWRPCRIQACLVPQLTWCHSSHLLVLHHTGFHSHRWTFAHRVHSFPYSLAQLAPACPASLRGLSWFLSHSFCGRLQRPTLMHPHLKHLGGRDYGLFIF